MHIRLSWRLKWQHGGAFVKPCHPLIILGKSLKTWTRSSERWSWKIMCHAGWMIHFGLLQWLTHRIINLSQSCRSHIPVHSWKCPSVKLHKITDITALSHYQVGKNCHLNAGIRCKRIMIKGSLGFFTEKVYIFIYHTIHIQLVPWCCKSDNRNQQAFIVWMFANSIICHLICTEAEAQLRFHNNGNSPVGGPEAAWRVCSCVLDFF